MVVDHGPGDKAVVPKRWEYATYCTCRPWWRRGTPIDPGGVSGIVEEGKGEACPELVERSGARFVGLPSHHLTKVKSIKGVSNLYECPPMLPHTSPAFPE